MKAANNIYLWWTEKQIKGFPPSSRRLSAPRGQKKIKGFTFTPFWETFTTLEVVPSFSPSDTEGHSPEPLPYRLQVEYVKRIREKLNKMSLRGSFDWMRRDGRRGKGGAIRNNSDGERDKGEEGDVKVQKGQAE